MSKILGIDCSSSCIGYSVIEINKNNEIIFQSMKYLKPIKKGSIVDRMVDTRNKMKQIIEEIKPDYIAIEDIIKFMKGKSTATTIITLTTFNRMICLLAYDYLGKPPELCNVMSIRHGIKLNKKFPKKEEIPELLEKHFNFEFPWELKKTGTPKIENYDKADAAAVALYYSLILTNKIKKKK